MPVPVRRGRLPLGLLVSHVPSRRADGIVWAPRPHPPLSLPKKPSLEYLEGTGEVGARLAVAEPQPPTELAATGVRPVAEPQPPDEAAGTGVRPAAAPPPDGAVVMGAHPRSCMTRSSGRAVPGNVNGPLTGTPFGWRPPVQAMTSSSSVGAGGGGCGTVCERYADRLDAVGRAAGAVAGPGGIAGSAGGESSSSDLIRIPLC